jgi:hypothetical protein
VDNVGPLLAAAPDAFAPARADPELGEPSCCGPALTMELKEALGKMEGVVVAN